MTAITPARLEGIRRYFSTLTPEQRKQMTKSANDSPHWSERHGAELVRERISDALRAAAKKATPEQRKQRATAANEEMKRQRASGTFFKNVPGPVGCGKNKFTSEKIARSAAARCGTKNPVFRIINGKTHGDRLREGLVRNGTIKCGRHNGMFGRPSHGGRRTFHRLATGIIVSMRSTWEAAFACYLESISVPYLYEPKTFDFGNLTYTPDFYLSGVDLWVEIKGFMRKDDERRIALLKQGHQVLIIGNQEYRELNLSWFRAKALEQDALIRVERVPCTSC